MQRCFALGRERRQVSPNVAEALRPEPREIDETAEREQRYVRRMFDVAFSRRVVRSRGLQVC